MKILLKTSRTVLHPDSTADILVSYVNFYCVHINSIFTASLQMHDFLDWCMLRHQQFVITLLVDYITKPLKIVVMQMIIDGLLMVVKVTVFSQIY